MNNSTRIYTGITLVPQNTTAVSTAGDLRYNTSTNKLELFNTGVDPVVTEALAATLTNKTISGSSNTLSNIAYSSLVLTNSIVTADLTANSVTNAKLAQMATLTIKGNNTGGASDPLDLTVAQVKTMLNLAGTNSGDVTLTAVGAVPNANGASLATQALTLQPADATNPGVLTAGTQTIGGAKTLSTSIQSPSHLFTGTGGNVTLQASASSTTSYTAKLPAVQATSNGQVLTNDGSGNLTWATPAAGTKNYLTAYIASTASGASNSGNGNIEYGTTTGWGLGTVALTSNFPSGTPTFGSGASGNLALTATSSSPLAGGFSLQYASSAATTAGNFVASDAFFIDREDQSKVLTVKFYYSPTVNPTNGNWSGTSSNSFGVALYDVTTGGSAGWIQPAGIYGMTQSSGVGLCTATFQTTSSSTQYRLVIYNANATAGAITLLFDDLSVGPQTAPIGPVITDWVAYNPTITGFGTTTPNPAVAYSRRVGDTLQVHGTFQAGTVSGTNASLSIGYNGVNGGVTIDTTKVGTLKQLLGKMGVDANNTTTFDWSIVYGTTTTVYLSVQSSANTAVNVPQAGNIVSGNSNQLSYFFEVPIVGWSSSVQMSNDTDTRVVSFSGTQTTQGVTAGVTNIAFTSTYDSHAAWNGTQYVVPVSGAYIVSGKVGSSAGGVDIYKNGSVVTNNSFFGGTTNGGSFVIQCIAGDLLSLRNGSNATITNGAIGIWRLSGPAIVAANESVNMRYIDNAGSLTIGTGLSLIKFGTKTFDSHNRYDTSTGLYTVPVSGKYAIKTSVFTNSVTITTGQSVQMQVFQNASAMSITQVVGNGASAAYTVGAADTYNCVAGDTISVQVKSSVATTTLAGLSWLAIERVGN